jgi:hypothetical protein
MRDARRHDACGVDSTRVERIRKCGRLRKASSEVSSCDGALFMRPFEAIRFFGCSTRRDLHFSSLGFSNRASTNVTPKQKLAVLSQIYFGVTANAYSIITSETLGALGLAYVPAIFMSDLQFSEMYLCSPSPARAHANSETQVSNKDPTPMLSL